MMAFDCRIAGFQFIAYYFFWYAVGFYIRKYAISVPWRAAWVLLLLWLAAAAVWHKHEPPFFLQGIPHLPAAVATNGWRYLTALLATGALLGLAPRLLANGGNWAVRCLVYWGKISLGIYVIHLFIGRWAAMFWTACGLCETSAAYALCDFALRLCVSILLVEIIKKCRPASLLLLGKG